MANNQNESPLPTNAGKNKRRNSDLIPRFYRTNSNKKFIQSTLDQLTQPGVVKKVNGFIGRQNAKSSTGDDIFVSTVDATRQNYQLEPGLVVKDTLGNVDFYKDYIDYINQLGVFGAKIDNHERLNRQEFYSWNPHIDWDKFVNFQQYYWLPYGPTVIDVFGQTKTISSTYTVTVEDQGNSKEYLFTPNGLTRNPVIKLYRGQTYNFEITSLGEPFSIKTAKTPGSADRYTWGEETSFAIQNGTMTFTVPDDAPNVLYYVSENDANLGNIFKIYNIKDNTEINVDTEIVGKKTYKLANGTPLSNGMKLRFRGDVTPSQYANDLFYVEGVGDKIYLVAERDLEIISTFSETISIPFDDTPFDRNPLEEATSYAGQKDYIVINRASKDRNPWSRYNRWFHKSVIETSAALNNQIADFDQTARAIRPIIEFNAGLKLYNFGYEAILDIDLFDTVTTDAFSTIEGEPSYYIDSTQLTNGHRVVFAADTDILVRNKIYRVEFIEVTPPQESRRRQIRLIEESSPVENQTALIKYGRLKQGLTYWFDGTNWIEAQTKTAINQAPLFDVVDDNFVSFGDRSVYDGSTFIGTKLFSYSVGTGATDSELGFALDHKNINNVGDILFNFNLLADTFTYKSILDVVTVGLSTGTLIKTNGLASTSYINGWEISKVANYQPVIRIYRNSNQTNNFNIDVYDDITNLADLVVRVYINGKRLDQSLWSVIDGPIYKQVVLVTSILDADVLTIKSFARQSKNSNGYYEVPLNLQNNPLNADIKSFTLGEVIDHVDSIIDNLNNFTGAYPGLGNLRDLGNISPYGTRFVQHSGALPLAIYHLTSKNSNIIKAIQEAQNDYGKFKRQFMLIAESSGDDIAIPAFVDKILEEVNKNNPKSFPYYFSDMVAYGAATVTDIPVVDYRTKYYPLSTNFNTGELSPAAVLIYVNGVQIKYGIDYTFDGKGFAIITYSALADDDIITIVEYETTDGSFVPPTPTKLGLWPKYEPKKYLDTTLLSPQYVIQGHDGSIVLAYNDYRDDLLLELELRIFNNIKFDYDPIIFDVNDYIPRYVDDAEYSLQEFNEILAPNFYQWTKLVDRDFTKPFSYDRLDPFTFNYRSQRAPDGRETPGYWRGIYRWIYDTDRPHLCPWEMLGFSIMPAWWQDQYGPAPYTSDNLVMWQDISEGIIRDPNKPIFRNPKYVRPFLMESIPANSSGELRSPYETGVATGIITTSSRGDYIFGDVSPVESAWRRSSYYPFAVLSTLLLTHPAEVMGKTFDRSRIYRDLAGQFVYKDTKVRIRLADITTPNIYSDTTRVQTCGLVNYLVDYIQSDNLKSLTQYKYDLENLNLQLAYRIAGFTEKEKFNLILDSKNPTAVGGVFVPQENYTVHFNSSSPTKKLVYSGVIITKLSTGYEVKGYSQTTPYFYYYPWSQVGNVINVGGISETFSQWTASQFYVAGKVVQYSNAYFRVKTTHTATASFDSQYYQKLSALPIVGGRDAYFRNRWDRTELITVAYGTKFRTIQEVVDFLLGYGEYLKDQGFIFDDFNNTLGAITDWRTAAKEFLFWTTQNWSSGEDKWEDWLENQDYKQDVILEYNGDYYVVLYDINSGSVFDATKYKKLSELSTIGASVIALSPSASNLIAKIPYNVVDDIRDQFNGYEFFRADGEKLEPEFVNSFREDNSIEYSPTTTSAEGIFGATFYLIQKEHILLIDNTTLFNDTIYDPATGYRQEKIKVSGYISTNWYGGFDIPGFIYDQAFILNWTAWTDYNLGDVVKYKEFYYSALSFLVGSVEFSVTDSKGNPQWVKLDTKPTSRMLPNWSYKADQFTDFYSLDSDNFDIGQQKMAQHLIGYQKRQYLENIIQDDISEYKFYQGMIIEKGTQNVLNKLFDVLSADDKESIKFFEEWAVRVGQYGSSKAYEEIEFELNQNLFKLSPQPFELVNVIDPSVVDFVIRQTANDVYLKPLGYNSAPWPVKSTHTPYLRTPGYVRTDEVAISIDTLDDIINEDITQFSEGDYVHCAFEGRDWNVYRLTKYNFNILTVSYNKTNKILTFTTDVIPGIAAGDIIGILNDDNIKGFHKVSSVSSTTVTINKEFKTFPDPNTVDVSVLLVYGITSQRVKAPKTVDNLDEIIPARLQTKERIWVDDNGNGRWSVYQHANVYSSSFIRNTKPSAGLKFGQTVSIDISASLAATSNTRNQLITFERAGPAGSWVQRQILVPVSVATLVAGDFAQSIAFSPDKTWMAVGSPNASAVKSQFKGTWSNSATYVKNDIVLYSGKHYTALGAVPAANTPSVNTNYWQFAPLITATTAGSASAYTTQGFVSIYKRNASGEFVFVTDFISPTPVSGELFGSTITFAGNNTMFVSAIGYNLNAGKLYQFDYTTQWGMNYSADKFGYLGVSNVQVTGTFSEKTPGTYDIPSSVISAPQLSTGSKPTLKLTYFLTDAQQPNGDWLTAKSYVSNDKVRYDGIVYNCNSSHTSDTFATDLAANKWVIVTSSTAYVTVTTPGWGYITLPTISGSALQALGSTGTGTIVLTVTSPVSDKFGYALTSSSDGTYLAVSAPGRFSVDGAVCTYKLVNGDYTLISTLKGDTLADAEEFGSCISLSSTGEYLAVGSRYADDTLVDQGKVTVWKYNGVNYRENEEDPPYQTIKSRTPEVGEQFGAKIGFMNGGNSLAILSINGDTDNIATFDVYSKLLANSTELYGTKYINDPTSPALNTETTFDNNTTKILYNRIDSGRVDVYDKYNTTWVYAESLSPAIGKSTDPATGFGTSFAVGDNTIVVTAPTSLDQTLVSGKIYSFEKPYKTTSWTVLHSELEVVNLEKIKKVFLYNKKTNELVSYLDIIDPLQGNFAGIAEQELKFKTFYDPATYKIGTDAVNIDDGMAWTDKHVGMLWWDMSRAKFLDYNNGDLVYRNSTWNKLYDTASIDIYEWVEATILPSAWDKLADTETGLASSISGLSLYGDSVYSYKERYDNIAKTLKKTYYFWVKNKTIVPDVPDRRISAKNVADLLEDPKGQGLQYIAFTGPNSFSLANIEKNLLHSDINLAVEYWTINQYDINSHSQWRLISSDNNSSLPTSIEEKLIDSLCGKDQNDRVVPDYGLAPKLRYGIENRPRQSMFINRIEALKQYIERANSVLIKHTIVEERDLSDLNTYEAEPRIERGLYDVVKDTDLELRFIGASTFRLAVVTPVIIDGRITEVIVVDSGQGYINAPYIDVIGNGINAKLRTILNNVGQVTGAYIYNSGEGYDDSTTTLSVRSLSALVHSDTTALGTWSIYTYDTTSRIWSRVRSQNYDVRNYWEYTDWYGSYTDPDTGLEELYSQFTLVDFSVEAAYLLPTLDVKVGQIVKVNTVGTGGWLLLRKFANVDSIDYTQSYTVIGRQSGTIQIKDTLYNFRNTSLGYDGPLFDGDIFDNTATTEVRVILTAIKNKILIDNLKQDYLDLFFACVRYAFNEQTYIDWIFKTSFVRAQHNVGELKEKRTFNNDNLVDFESYVSEVKPYRTKVREFVSAYDRTEPAYSLITDFDLQSTYLNKKLSTVDVNIINGLVSSTAPEIDQYPWKNWTDNVGFSLTSITLVDGGSNYIQAPEVRINGGYGSGATARAFISQGKVNRIVLLTSGSGYLEVPTIELDGGLSADGGVIATAVAYIGDSVVRSNYTKIKFDRVSGNYYITKLQETETFTTISSSQRVFNLKWSPTTDILNSTVQVNGIDLIRGTYTLTSVKSVTRGYTSYSGLLTLTTAPSLGATVSVTYLKDFNYLSAADRINWYYNPDTNELGKDLSQLMQGVDYGGVQIIGLGFEISQGWDSTPWYTDAWDALDPTFDDYIVTTSNANNIFILPFTPANGEEVNIYYRVFGTEEFYRIDDTPYTTVNIVDDGGISSTATYDSIIDSGGAGTTGSEIIDGGASIQSELIGQIIMPTFVGNGTAKQITIPLTLTINAGDEFIFRRSTSDGSIKTLEYNYDTALSGGDLAYSSATGLSPDDIIVDGDDLVSVNTSHGPEESVPGQIVDTLAIKVTTKPTSGSAQIEYNNYVYDGVTRIFSIKNEINSKQAVAVLFSSKKQPLIIDEDFTVDYKNKEVTLTNLPSVGTVVSIITFGFSGANLLELDYFVSNGTSNEYITNTIWGDALTSIVYINGETTGYELFKTDSSYDEAGLTGIRLAAIPADGSIVSYVLSSSPTENFSVMKSETFIADGVETTYNLNNQIGTSLPLEANILVYQNFNNNTEPAVYTGPSSTYYVIETDQLEYAIPTNRFVPYSINVSDILVSIDNIPLTVGTDYIVDLSTISISLRQNVYNNSIGKELMISVIRNSSYSCDGNSITFDQPPPQYTKITVVSFYKHESLGIQRTEVNVLVDATLTPDTLEHFIYHSPFGKEITLDRAVLDDSRVWLVKNGRMLQSSIDYKLNPNLTSVTLAKMPSADDVFTVITFGSNVVEQSFSFMQFKDMLNRIHYKRLRKGAQTKLAEDLNFNDSEIVVVDDRAVSLPNRNLNLPGIIEIHGERIEYFVKTGNRLSQLRRGTLGTGVRTVYLAGTSVQDISISETIPYKDETIIETLVSNGIDHEYDLQVITPTLELNTMPSTWYRDTIPLTHGQSNDIEVFAGGWNIKGEWVANIEYLVGEIVMYGSYTYKCMSTHTSNSDFFTDLDLNKWKFFVGNIRLKKKPYKIHNSYIHNESPEGDIQFEADFSVNGFQSVRLTNPLTEDTKFTVVKTVGKLWEDPNSSLADSQNVISKFIKFDLELINNVTDIDGNLLVDENDNPLEL